MLLGLRHGDRHAPFDSLMLTHLSMSLQANAIGEAEQTGQPLDHPLAAAIRAASSSPDLAVDFFTLMLHPDPARRLSMQTATQHAYVQAAVSQVLTTHSSQEAVEQIADNWSAKDDESQHSLSPMSSFGIPDDYFGPDGEFNSAKYGKNQPADLECDSEQDWSLHDDGDKVTAAASPGLDDHHTLPEMKFDWVCHQAETLSHHISTALPGNQTTGATVSGSPSPQDHPTPSASLQEPPQASPEQSALSPPQASPEQSALSPPQASPEQSALSPPQASPEQSVVAVHLDTAGIGASSSCSTCSTGSHPDYADVQATVMPHHAALFSKGSAADDTIPSSSMSAGLTISSNISSSSTSSLTGSSTSSPASHSTSSSISSCPSSLTSSHIQFADTPTSLPAKVQQFCKEALQHAKSEALKLAQHLLVNLVHRFRGILPSSPQQGPSSHALADLQSEELGDEGDDNDAELAAESMAACGSSPPAHHNSFGSHAAAHSAAPARYLLLLASDGLCMPTPSLPLLHRLCSLLALSAGQILLLSHKAQPRHSVIELSTATELHSVKIMLSLQRDALMFVMGNT